MIEISSLQPAVCNVIGNRRIDPQFLHAAGKLGPVVGAVIDHMRDDFADRTFIPFTLGILIKDHFLKCIHLVLPQVSHPVGAALFGHAA